MKVASVEKLVKECFDVYCKNAEDLYLKVDCIEDAIYELLEINHVHINTFSNECLQISVEFDPKITNSIVVKDGIKKVCGYYE